MQKSHITQLIRPSICSLYKFTVLGRLPWNLAWGILEALGRAWSGWRCPSAITSRSGAGVKFGPSLLCIKFSNFELQYLQNYPVDLNRIWYVSTCPQDVYESGVTTPVDLFIKSGGGVKLAYSILLIFMAWLPPKLAGTCTRTLERQPWGQKRPSAFTKRVVHV